MSEVCLWNQESRVLSYLAIADCASPVLADVPPAVAGPPAGMVAFRTADLRARGGKTAAVPAGTMMTFCHPVVTAPAVIRRMHAMREAVTGRERPGADGPGDVGGPLFRVWRSRQRCAGRVCG